MFQALLNENHQSNKIGDLFPVKDYYPEYGVFLCKSKHEKKHKHIAISFIADPIPGGGSTSIESSLHSLLTLDHKFETFLSVMLFTHTNFKQSFHHYDALRVNQARGERKQICNDYTEVNKEFFQRHSTVPINGESGIRVRDMKVWITLKVPFKGKKPSKEALVELHKLSKQFKAALDRSYLWSEQLDRTLYLEYMQSFLNWGNDSKWQSVRKPQVRAGIPLSDQIIDPGNIVGYGSDEVVMTENGSLDNQRHIKIGTVKEWPGEISIGYMQQLIGDWFDGGPVLTDHFFFTLNIQILDSKKHLSKLRTKYVNAKNQSMGKLGAWLKQAQKQKEVFDTFYSVLKGGHLVKTNLKFGINTDSSSRAISAFSTLKTSFEQHQMTILEEKNILMPIFLECLPFGVDTAAYKILDRYQYHASKQAVSMMPVCSEWKGTGTPVLQFVSRTGQLMNFDLWDGKTSMNAIIMATTGAGKSVLANTMIMNYMGSGEIGKEETGAQIYIIDVGRSYENTVAELGGTFVEFKANRKFSINPFSLIHDDTTEGLSEQISMLVNIFSSMLDKTGVITPYESATLTEYITLIWNKYGKDSTVELVGQALLVDKYHSHFKRSKPDPRVCDMGVKMMPFMDNGVYGEFLSNKHEGIDLNDDLICLELEELKDKPQLQSVVLMILICKIQYTMYIQNNPNRKIFILDEAWSFISSSGSDGGNENIAAFLETAYRRLRKYGAAGLIITQSCMDIARSSVGAVLFENTPNKLFLQQDGNALTQAKETKVLPYDDITFKYLETVKTEKFKHSEIFFDTQKGSGIGRLYVPPYQLMLFSTAKEDKTPINAYKDQGYNHMQSIKLVMRDRKMDGYENYNPEDDAILKNDMTLIS